MKTKSTLAGLVVLTSIACGLTACSSMQTHRQQKLLSEARVTRADAEQTALAKVPGRVKEAELEREKGKLLWSFEIVRAGSKQVSEVEVDAKTGDILGVKTEE